MPTLIVFRSAKNCRPTADLITRMVGKFLPTYIFPNSEGWNLDVCFIQQGVKQSYQPSCILRGWSCIFDECPNARPHSSVVLHLETSGDCLQNVMHFYKRSAKILCIHITKRFVSIFLFLNVVLSYLVALTF